MSKTPLTSKALPVSNSELERIQRDFKLFSPVQKPYKTAPLPKAGEEWKLERTLPSGLNVVPYKLWETVSIPIKQLFFGMVLGKTFESGVDVRHLQYNIEQYKRNKPWFELLPIAENRKTDSISWHPTEMLLVTTGTGCLTKLWNAKTGDLITKYPYWQTNTDSDTISWSYDGKLFARNEYIFDGENGEPLERGRKLGDSILGVGCGRYSNDNYQKLRGIHVYSDSGGTSHLSSSNNFSPWRPNSNQYIVDDHARFIALGTDKGFNLWKPSSDQYGKCLVFRNGRTGEIEKVIDCSVESKIIDFAWHPRGRFIAVAFEKHKIRIIDIDDVRTIDGLSVQFLVGWSPDGKILVAREDKYKGDFVIWDALEIKEKTMPEKMRNELWFKRFFTNISADGLRYIKIEREEGQIYSVDSDELIATLPKQVSSAAWSPIDGGLLATCGGSETHIWVL